MDQKQKGKENNRALRLKNFEEGNKQVKMLFRAWKHDLNYDFINGRCSSGWLKRKKEDNLVLTNKQGEAFTNTVKW